ncbi:MAG: tRNA lysidine(34) synthetase TilS [Paludibacteraceae bacterium]
MIYKVSAFIKQQQLFYVDSKLLVAVSGGVDSIVMLHLLHSLHYDCVVAHCNFHLRGSASDADADFVEEQAKRLGIKFLKTDFDTKKYAVDKKISIEMAARNLRYEWFEKMRRQERCDCIVVAHHIDDSVETFFLNLVRGTGLKGLSGIAPKNGFVVRPLLCCTRTEIAEYAEEHCLSHCEDATNADNIYRRNFIRNKIVPLFKELNPAFHSTMCENIKHIANVNCFISNYINSLCNDLIISDGCEVRIAIENLKKELLPAFVLYELLAPYGFNSAVVEQIFRQIDNAPGRRFYSASHCLIKDRDCLILEPVAVHGEESFCIKIDDTLLQNPLKIAIRQGSITDCFIEKSGKVALLDLHKLTFPLRLRHWQKGDWFIPFGMKGKKKLSDFFSDKKYSLFDKEKCWLLVDDTDAVVWVVGERIDNRFRITDATTRFYRLEVL